MSEYTGTKDNEVFAKLEERYLSTRDNHTFWAMYSIIQRYEARYIRKYCRAKGCRLGPNDEEHEEMVQELSKDMALWFMSRYANDPTFKCDKGMSAYGHWAFLKIMHDPNRQSEEISKKELDETEVQYDHTVVIQDFETEIEKRDRWHQEKVAPGVYQGILPIFGESNIENV